MGDGNGGQVGVVMSTTTAALGMVMVVVETDEGMDGVGQGLEVMVKQEEAIVAAAVEEVKPSLRIS